MFKNTAIFGHFSRIQLTFGGKLGRNYQKAHLYDRTFHLNPLPNRYDNPFKSSSPYNEVITDGRPNS